MKYNIFPKNEKERNIFFQLQRDGHAYTRDTNLTQAFGTRRDIKKLIDKDILDIARIRKKDKSIIAIIPKATIIPILTGDSVYFQIELNKI